ncbi:MAG: ATP-binding cassette domain-containing protein [Candidatus Shapirobacteria bacterium]|jgi:ABC-2 type transport system ATP-binding protein
MIKVTGINKSFGSKQVLKNIDFSIKNDSVVGLLGPNGAGKTTLMRVMVGFLSPNSGVIEWNGEIAETKSAEYRGNIGYLPENNPLYPTNTVNEYLELIANLKNLKEPKKEVVKVIKECGLVSVVSQKIEILSKGFKQRVGLAAAIIGNPKILILDEPTSGLDPNQIIEIRKVIKKLAKNKIIIFSTHILPEAKAVCDRLLIINKGQIVLDELTGKVKNLEKKFVELTV